MSNRVIEFDPPFPSFLQPDHAHFSAFGPVETVIPRVREDPKFRSSGKSAGISSPTQLPDEPSDDSLELTLVANLFLQPTDSQSPPMHLLRSFRPWMLQVASGNWQLAVIAYVNQKQREHMLAAAKQKARRVSRMIDGDVWVRLTRTDFLFFSGLTQSSFEIRRRTEVAVLQAIRTLKKSPKRAPDARPLLKQQDIDGRRWVTLDYAAVATRVFGRSPTAELMIDDQHPSFERFSRAAADGKIGGLGHAKE